MQPFSVVCIVFAFLLVLWFLLRVQLKRLEARSSPGSRYAKRWITVTAHRMVQIWLSFFCVGPLKTLFLGRDPFSIISKIRQYIRDLDSRMMCIRPPNFAIGEQGIDITIPLRDGMKTTATLYSPMNRRNRVDMSPRPVVLVRTPYNRKALAPWGFRFAERGYHFVAQDTRGRFGSSGDFFPLFHEISDGAATIEWIEKQPWCNGSVGMTGISYLGMASWTAMREQVPALKAVAPILAATDVHNTFYGRHSGAAHIELLFRWTYLVIHLMSKPFGILEAIFTFFCGDGQALRNAYTHLPLDEADTKFLNPKSQPLHWFHSIFANSLGTELFWKGKKKCVDISQLDRVPPVLLFCGWYDFFCSEQLHDYKDLCRKSKDCRIVIGPFTHWSVLSMYPKMFRSLFDFFDFHLLKDNFVKPVASVEVFSMGHKMRWREMDSWPPKDIATAVYALDEADDGSLLLQRDFQKKKYLEKKVSYSYDPSDPTPNIGGATFSPTNCGRHIQNQMEKRSDVLIFTSEPLKEPVTIAGEVKIRLVLISNVEGTDYVARMCHVTPDGTSENIADGIVRKFDLKIGARTEIEISLSPTMNCLGVGDRLRLQVCSSAFPKYGRHLNTSAPFHLAKYSKVSNQNILVGGENCSEVTIPILSSE